MKRDFLRELGIEDEAINKIMAEHGQTLNGEKSKYEAQLTALRQELEQAESPEVDVEELSQAQRALEKANERIDALERNNSRLLVETKFTEAGFKEDDYKEVIADLVTGDSEASLQRAERYLGLLTKAQEAAKEKVLSEARDEYGDPPPAGQKPDSVSKAGEYLKRFMPDSN